MKDYNLCTLKHDVFSLVFKIKSSLELSAEEEFRRLALSNLELLERTLERIFLMECIEAGRYRLKRESFNPTLLAGEVFKVHLKGKDNFEGDPLLFAKALSSLKDSIGELKGFREREGSLEILCTLDTSTQLKRFFADFASKILSLQGIKLKIDSSKIEIVWGRF